MSQMTPASSPAVPTSASVAVAPVAVSATAARRWLLWIGALLALIAVVGLGSTVGMYKAWRDGGRIASGVSVQGISVSGLTPSQAKTRLQEAFSALQVEVQTPDHVYTFPLGQMGGQPQWAFAATQAGQVGREASLIPGAWQYWVGKEQSHNLALSLNWDKTALRRALQDAAKDYQRDPEDARLKFSNGAMIIEGGQNGHTLDWAATAKLLQHRGMGGFVGKSGEPAPLQLAAITHSTAPRVSAAALQGRDVPLGSYTTSFNPGLVGRTLNVHLAARAIDGHVLMPGELFSFNAMTGERTWDKGYRMAHIFQREPGQSEAQVVEGLAGGTCQVSSTLFNAVRKSNQKTSDGLEIVERNHHSLPVTYVPRGLDATVAWPYKDFKFRNTLTYPVYLRTGFSGARITVSIWARVPYNGTVPNSTDDTQPSDEEKAPTT